MAVELSITQFQVCQEANGQFCSITTPFQPLANLPSCVSVLYARNPAGIISQYSLQIRKTSDVNLPTQISPDVWILWQLCIPQLVVPLELWQSLVCKLVLVLELWSMGSWTNS